jgi:membrane-bound serine protease (ClpP class)
MFLVLALVLLLLLPSPWNWVGALASTVLFVFETRYWHRRVRRLRVATGREDLVGATGVAVDRLSPAGHVRIRGELWDARAAEDVPEGALVRVTAVDGLLLDVVTSDNGTRPEQR